MSSLQPGILNKVLMYISQHKHLGRGKGSQLNSSSKKQQQLKVMDQKVSRSVIKQNRSSPFRPDLSKINHLVYRFFSGSYQDVH